jgi:hypothetical protein
VVGCGALHRGDNFSRHSPIWLTLNLGALPLGENVKRFAPRKPAWLKSMEDNIQSYTTQLEARLESLTIPESLNCQNPLVQTLATAKSVILSCWIFFVRVDLIRAKKLFEAALQGDLDLLEEMKQIKSGWCGQEELPDTVAGSNGESEIVDKFREVYSTLYNSSGSQEGMETLKAHVQGLLGPQSMDQVKCLTGEAVKEAACSLKPRCDVSGGFTSDALLNAPDILFNQLAAVFRDWIVHGTVTAILLACTFLPLLKSSLKDPANPGSYRAIAGSSLILKLFEKTVLLLWGDLLTSDSLQFGYKSGTSATQWWWWGTEGGIQPPGGGTRLQQSI